MIKYLQRNISQAFPTAPSVATTFVGLVFSLINPAKSQKNVGFATQNKVFTLKAKLTNELYDVDKLLGLFTKMWATCLIKFGSFQRIFLERNIKCFKKEILDVDVCELFIM